MADANHSTADFAVRFAEALRRRQVLLADSRIGAMRVFSGPADGIDGLFVDRYATGATMLVYEGRAADKLDHPGIAQVILQQLSPLGVQAVYFKPFARDRSRLGGELPEVATQPDPLAGSALAQAIIVREYDWQLEIRLYDGLSTGLFLDQRDNRRWVHEWVTKRAAQKRSPPMVLNTFAYTCAFSVAAARAGAITASVDVSPRYLEWGKRNFAHNQIAVEPHRFARMDTFEFFSYAKRKELRFDLIILDPPSFSVGSKKKGIRPWSSVEDYARLVRGASELLQPRGTIFASTNTQELCRPKQLENQIIKGLGSVPQWLDLPDVPVDFARDQDRFAARAFVVG